MQSSLRYCKDKVTLVYYSLPFLPTIHCICNFIDSYLLVYGEICCIYVWMIVYIYVTDAIIKGDLVANAQPYTVLCFFFVI